jgi:hypothetical protein
MDHKFLEGPGLIFDLFLSLLSGLIFFLMPETGMLLCCHSSCAGILRW